MDAVAIKTLRLLKDCRDSLTPQQYRTIKGQVLAGNTEAAIRGLQKLLKNSAEGVCKEKKPRKFYTFVVQHTKQSRTMLVTTSTLKAGRLLTKGLRIEVWKGDRKIETIYAHTKEKLEKYPRMAEVTP